LHTFTFFESPHRIAATLSEIGSRLGERQIVVGRELTKRYQELIRGSAQSVAARLRDPRGEITVVVGPVIINNLSYDQTSWDDSLPMAVALFGQLTNSGLSRRQAMSDAARQFGLPTRVVYAAVERAKETQ
jgi:16S rRNA (cytidine1402-2'-O)-methyltransferase